MKKVAILAATIALVACTDDKEKQMQHQLQMQQQQLQAQQQQLNQQQYAQQPQYAPAQPQVIQAPAAPVVVQPQQQDNTLTNMALGAVIGHTIANMGNNDSRSSNQIIEHKTVIVDNRSNTPHDMPTHSLNTPAPIQSVAPPAIAPVAPKSSAMDMNKLSTSANQTFNTGTPSPASAPIRTNSMDMSKLSSKPSVNLAKPSSSMNMSKLSRR
jgi:hypothetical protein